MAIAVKLTGLDGLMVAVNKTIAAAEQETKVALNTFAKSVEKDAKAQLQRGGGRYGPTSNTGNLANSVVGTVTGMQAKITVTANYAAYIEFGTRKFAAKYVATLPQDWKTYAATFKGKGGGDYYEFLNDILDWVIAKGIASRYSVKTQKAISINLKKPSKGKDATSDRERLESTAYAIALSILRNGIRAQPFLYPAVTKHTPELIADIKKVFDIK